MDGRDFDDLLRNLTALRSRRGLVRAVGGTLAVLGVPGLAHLTADDAAAKKRKHRKKCKGGATKCNGTCVNTKADSAHCGSCGFACPPSQAACVNGACAPSACPAGQIRCEGDCVDTEVDA